MKKIIVRNSVDDIKEREDGMILGLTYSNNDPVFVPIESGENINIGLIKWQNRKINTTEDIYQIFPYNFRSLDSLYKNFQEFANVKPTLTQPQTEKIRKLVLNCGYLPTKPIMDKLRDHYTILSTPLVFFYALQMHTPQTKPKIGEEFFIPEAGWNDISECYVDLRRSLHKQFNEKNINISFHLLEFLITIVNDVYLNHTENDEEYEPINPENIDEFMALFEQATAMYDDIDPRYYQILTKKDPKEIFYYEYGRERNTVSF